MSTEKIAAPQLPIPAFSDVGKASNDIINKDFYHASAAALEVKLKTPTGVAFTTRGTSSQDNKLSASVEGKKSFADGITTTTSWNTASILSTKVEAANYFTKGLKSELVADIAGKAGFKGAKGNVFFQHPLFHFRAFTTYAPSGSLSSSLDVVAGKDGFLVGGDVGYDLQKAAITRYSAAVGYTGPTYALALKGEQSLSVFTALYYQKVNEATEVGIKTAYDAKSSSNLGIELATKYKIDPTSFAKAKISDRGIASIAYNTKVNSGFTFGVGASFDTQKLNETGHKIGASFTFEG